jgi:hypothetical protein
LISNNAVSIKQELTTIRAYDNVFKNNNQIQTERLRIGIISKSSIVKNIHFIKQIKFISPKNQLILI